MEWQIPEPLNIRPCQKPLQFKSHQLNLYPVRLKKLPEWVDNASFQSQKILQSKDSCTSNPKEISLNNEIFSSLFHKYKNKQKYTLIYEREEQKYTFSAHFAYEYISTDYSPLNQHSAFVQLNNEKIEFTEKQKNSNLTILFDSKFECGNLSKVFKVENQHQYHLIMQNDVNTVGYNQWYAFSINNLSSQSQNLDIKIVNFVKQSSLYKKGMKPWYIQQGFSTWKPIPNRCTYKKSNVKNSDGQLYSQLSFQIKVNSGYTFISMLPLYSFTRLCSKIQKWKSIKGMKLYHKHIYTLINNRLPILQYIPHTSQQDEKEEQIKWYDTIVVFARIHPGEVWSSFLMEEFIQTVIHFHKSNYSKFKYLFFPMINPDGVIYGNFRCDFSGVDLNRVWIQPSKFFQPSIHKIKKILSKQFQHKKAKYFIDLHSHSKAFNVFGYTSAQTMLESRLVPDLIRLSIDNKIFDPVFSSNSLSKQFLNHSQTTFISSNDIFTSKKKSTARAFMTKLTERGKCITVQISFYGYENKKQSQSQVQIFSLMDFNDFSWCFLRKIHDCINEKQDIISAKKMLQTIYNFYQNDKEKESFTGYQNHSSQKKQADNVFDPQSQDSDSQPERFYTTQTKKIIKAKNGQIYDAKSVIHQNIASKRFLKQTQSTIKKIQVIRKVLSKGDLQKKKIREKSTQNSLLSMKKQLSLKKPVISQDFINSQPSELSSIRKTEKEIKCENQIQSSPIPDKPSLSRRKLLINTRKKQLKLIKQKKEPMLQGYAPKMKLESTSISPIQPIVVITETKDYQPTFGKFLTKTNRNATRKYKTFSKEESIAQRNQTSNQFIEDQNNENVKKLKVRSHFEGYIQPEIFRQQKTSSNKEDKHFMTESMKNEDLITQQTQKKQINRFESQFRIARKKSSNKEQLVNNKNRYLIQRKKILEIMKKQTRFCNQIDKQSMSLEHIESIIEKRKRTKTQADASNKSFQDRSIFYDNKMSTIKDRRKITNFKQHDTIRIRKKQSRERQSIK